MAAVWPATERFTPAAFEHSANISTNQTKFIYQAILPGDRVTIVNCQSSELEHAGLFCIRRVLLVPVFVTALACGTPASPEPSTRPADAETIVSGIQRQFRLVQAPHPADLIHPETTWAAGPSRLSPVPALRNAAATRIETAAAGGFVARFDITASPVARPASVRLGTTLADPFEVRDEESGISMRAKLLDVPAALGAVIGGYVLYEDNPDHLQVVHRPHREGTEDFVVFPRRPPDELLSYEIELGEGVAGLRLTNNVLELLNASGDPRLRVKAPWAVDSAGHVLPVALRVGGCEVDQSDALPWGRPVTEPGSRTCELVLRWEATTYPLMVDPGFETTGSMTTARYDHTATLLNDGRVLVVGGNAPNGIQSGAEVWNAGSFSAAGTMSTARRAHTATLLSDGRVLVVGGLANGSTYLSSAEAWDGGSFSPAGSMATTRSVHASTLLADGRVLAVGGYSGTAYLSSAEAWDGGSFSPAGSMTTPRWYHTSTLLLDGRVLVVGGYYTNGGTHYLSSAEVWNTGTFSPAGTMSRARTWHTSNLLPDGRVLVVGGISDGGVYLDTADTWSAGGFTAAGTMKRPKAWHTSTLLADGRVLTVGGRASSTMHLGYAEAWNEGSFHAAGSMSTARRHHTATRLLDGRVLVVGGLAISEYLSTAEIWDVETPGSSGMICVNGSDCTSGFCADGLCCDTICDAPNMACAADMTAAADGICSLIDSASACPTTFKDGYCCDVVCDTANVGCSAVTTGAANGVCALRMCATDNECDGVCVDGYCCDVPCDGTCQSCRSSDTGEPDGTCAPASADQDPRNDCETFGAGICQLPGVCDGAGACKTNVGLECGPSSCGSDSVQVNASKCDAVGQCVAGGTSDCSPYKCESSGCLSSCADASDCIGVPCVNGQCTAAQSLGLPCQVNEECESGYCTDGVCCDQLCDGGCESCVASEKASGSSGACGPIKAGQDYRNACDADSDPCGADGTCDGNGQCSTDAPASTPCGGSPTCDGTRLSSMMCDGQGNCSALTTDCADGYRCEAGACPSSCTSDTACLSNYRCENGECQPTALDAGSGPDSSGVDSTNPDGESGGCGCSTPGRSSGSSDVSLSVLIGLLVVLGRRRRLCSGRCIGGACSGSQP